MTRIFAAVFILLAFPASAQVKCFHPLHWAQIIGRYSETIHETQKRSAPSGEEVTIILWLNAETGSFTLSITRPDGAICALGGAMDGYANQTIDNLIGPAGQET